MVNLINLKETRLGWDDSFNKALRSIVMGIQETSKIINEAYVEKGAFTVEGRALFSLLEELTGNMVSKDYCLEKLNLLFEE